MTQDQKTELTRQKILTAALVEFGANGYAGASLNAICAAGIPKGLLYHNFKNKDALYLACVEHSFSTLTCYLKAADPPSDLEKYMAARFRFFQENEKEARIFFDAVLQPPEALRKSIQNARADFDQLNLTLYQEMLARIPLRKEISSADALAYFSMLQAMFNGYFSSPAFCALSFTDKISAHETNLAKLLDFMLYGIAERGCAE